MFTAFEKHMVGLPWWNHQFSIYRLILGRTRSLMGYRLVGSEVSWVTQWIQTLPEKVLCPEDISQLCPEDISQILPEKLRRSIGSSRNSLHTLWFFTDRIYWWSYLLVWNPLAFSLFHFVTSLAVAHLSVSPWNLPSVWFAWLPQLVFDLFIPIAPAKAGFCFG